MRLYAVGKKSNSDSFTEFTPEIFLRDLGVNDKAEKTFYHNEKDAMDRARKVRGEDKDAVVAVYAVEVASIGGAFGREYAIDTHKWMSNISVTYAYLTQHDISIRINFGNRKLSDGFEGVSKDKKKKETEKSESKPSEKSSDKSSEKLSKGSKGKSSESSTSSETSLESSEAASSKKSNNKKSEESESDSSAKSSLKKSSDSSSESSSSEDEKDGKKDKTSDSSNNWNYKIASAAFAAAGIGVLFVLSGGLPIAATLAVKVAVVAVVGTLSMALGAGIYYAAAYYNRNAKQRYENNKKVEENAIGSIVKDLPKKDQDKKFIKDLNKLLRKAKDHKFTDEGNEPTKADHIKQTKKGKDKLCLLQFAHEKLPKVVRIEDKKKRDAAEKKLLGKITKNFLFK